jgi:hypothetical protein
MYIQKFDGMVVTLEDRVVASGKKSTAEEVKKVPAPGQGTVALEGNTEFLLDSYL